MLVAKLRTMQQLSNHFSDVFSNQKEFSHRSIGIELASLIFYYSIIIFFIIIVINCQVPGFQT